MKNKKLLSVGCSFTAHCGFDQNIHKHWLPQFAKKYNFELTNLGLPGCSNAEIFLSLRSFAVPSIVKFLSIFIL